MINSLVTRVTVVRVSLKFFIEDTLVGKLAADREGVSHNSPLGLPPQCQHLAHIMDQPRHLEPLCRAEPHDISQWCVCMLVGEGGCRLACFIQCTFVWVQFTDAFGSLEGVDRVGQVNLECEKSFK